MIPTGAGGRKWMKIGKCRRHPSISIGHSTPPDTGTNVD